MAKKITESRKHYSIAFPDGLYAERFTYPASTTAVDKHWEKSAGVRIAQCCKMIVGNTPRRWPGPDSPSWLAQETDGALVELPFDPDYEE